MSRCSPPQSRAPDPRSTRSTSRRGKRVHYEKVVDGIGPVDPDEIKKGYEYEKGEYVLLDDDEIDAVKLETKQDARADPVRR